MVSTTNANLGEPNQSVFNKGVKIPWRNKHIRVKLPKPAEPQEAPEDAPAPLKRAPTVRKVFRAFTASAYKGITFDFSPPRTSSPATTKKGFRLPPLRFNPFPKAAEKSAKATSGDSGATRPADEVDGLVAGVGELKLGQTSQ
jgi:hypothetical protein